MISRISCDKSSSEFPVLTAGDISAFVTQFVSVFIFGFGSLTCGGTRVFLVLRGSAKSQWKMQRDSLHTSLQENRFMDGTRFTVGAQCMRVGSAVNLTLGLILQMPLHLLPPGSLSSGGQWEARNTVSSLPGS